MKKYFFTFSLLFASSFSWALGDQKDNGGNVIFCNKNGSMEIQLLDLYEGHVAYDFNFVPAQAKTMAEIFEERVQTLDKWNPTRANLYRQYFKSFSDEAKFLPPGNSIPNIGDEGWATVPDGCELKQIVVQQDIPTPEGIRYFVNRDLWAQLSEESKAALLLHEFIYREGRDAKNNFRNSSGVRYFNALIHSDLMPKLALKQYIAHLRYIGFQEAEAQGETIALFTWNKDYTVKTEQAVDFNSDNIVMKATLTDHFRTLSAGKLSDEVKCLTPIDGDHSVWFYDSGHISTIHIGCEPQAIRFQTKTAQGYMFGSDFTYDDDGNLHAVSMSSDRVHFSNSLVFSYRSQDYQLTCVFGAGPGSIDVEFYPEGTPKSVTTSNNNLSGWLNFQGQHWSQNEILLHPGYIGFNKDGTIASLPSPN